MKSCKTIHVVSAHACGEVGDVIVGGVAPPPGETLWDQRDWLEQDGQLRGFILNEPRGGVFRHVNLLVPPRDERADAAFLIMEPEDTPPMSGSNTMCVATVLLETGIVAMQEPVTRLTLEVPGGLIEVEASCAEGRVEKVSFANVASFASQLDVPLQVEGIGELRVDTAFGGDSYVIVEAADVGLALEPANAREFARLGAMITDAANAQLVFEHPQMPRWRHFSFCQFTAPVARRNGVLTGRNTVVIKPAKLDRSPCGTGTSARLAILHAKGQIGVGETFVSRSIIGSEFEARIEREVDLSGRRAIVPRVAGTAWITGIHQHMLDPADPWPTGYKLGDTWPGV